MVGLRGTFLEIPLIFIRRRRKCSQRAEEEFPTACEQ